MNIISKLLPYLAVSFFILSPLHSQTVTRDINDFVQANSIADSFTALPKTSPYYDGPDFFVWTDFSTGSLNAALAVDQVGFINASVMKSCGHDLNTQISGDITEKDIGSNTRELKITMHTKNALAYLGQAGSSFPWVPPSVSPLWLGYSPVEVCGGKPAALADVNTTLILQLPASGMPLGKTPIPSLRELAFLSGFGTVKFASVAINMDGALRDAGLLQLGISGTDGSKQGSANTTQVFTSNKWPNDRIHFRAVGP